MAKSTKPNKYWYGVVLQGNYHNGEGWLDIDHYTAKTNMDYLYAFNMAKKDATEMRKNFSGAIFRIIKARRLNK
ncbi:MAG: hypothetical protein M0R51_16490 [Clostridia bacterium]|jgi:hypothetical protein|nr:hypothetical protein [Clostridia bacterium]